MYARIYALLYRCETCRMEEHLERKAGGTGTHVSRRTARTPKLERTQNDNMNEHYQNYIPMTEPYLTKIQDYNATSR